jgi:hypothetical protein
VIDMTSDDDDKRARRRKIIEESRATLQRLQREEDQRPPAEVARRLIAAEDPAAKWRRAADERVRQRQEAELVAAGETASREWIEQRLAWERQLVFGVLADAIAGLRAEQRDMDHYAEITTELTRLWKAVVETKTMLVEICRDRVGRAFNEVGADPTKKMN